MAKNPHKKPVGRSGVNHIAFTGPGAKFCSESFELTGNKANDEVTVVRAFLMQGEQIGLPKIDSANVVQNAENDWDFTLKVPGGEIALELVEIAPKSLMRSGYQDVTSEHDVWPYCEAVFANIIAKSNKYSVPKTKSLELLVYVSHWTFYPSPDCVGLLKFWCATKAHKFDRIYLHLYAGSEGLSHRLFPPSDNASITSFNPDSVRRRYFRNIDPKGRGNPMVTRDQLPNDEGGAVIFAPQLVGNRPYGTGQYDRDGRAR
jgi:hypothetical protein